MITRNKNKIGKGCHHYRTGADGKNTGINTGPDRIGNKIQKKCKKSTIILDLLFLLIDAGMVMMEHDAEEDGTDNIY